MKRVLTLVLIFMAVIFMAACEPDENTATQMEEWKEKCELIETCDEWLTAEFEERLTESELISIIEARLDSIEGRVDKIEELLYSHIIEEEFLSASIDIDAVSIFRTVDDEYDITINFIIDSGDTTFEDDYDFNADLLIISNWMTMNGLTLGKVDMLYFVSYETGGGHNITAETIEGILVIESELDSE